MSALQSENTRAGTRVSSFDPFRALRAIRESMTLRSTLRLVALTLISHANASGESWPSYATLGRETGLDRRTAISAINALEREGVLEKETRRTSKGDPDSNRYRLKIGLPARPEPRDDVTTDTPPASTDTPPARSLAPQETKPGEVVIADQEGGDRAPPKQIREQSIPEERRPALLDLVAVKGDPWPGFLAEYSARRLVKYGIKGLIEPVSAEKRAAVTACLNEASAALGEPCEVVIGRVVRTWFDLPGNAGYLREKAHPFRALLADLDGLIAADVSRARDRARTRAREEAPKEARKEAPKEARTGFAGALGVLQALGVKVGAIGRTDAV